MIDSNYAKSIEGLISKKDLLKNLSVNFNLSPKKIEKLYLWAYKKKYKKNKKLYLIVNTLKKQGYKVAILSDQWHLSLKSLVSKKDYLLFDEIIVSCDVGIRKPNKKIYDLILKQLKVFPEETIFIDNQSWNIVPANKMGMRTILFVGNNKIKKQLKEFGVKV